MKEVIKIILTGLCTTALYYLCGKKDILIAQIIAWIFLTYSFAAALLLIFSRKIYDEALSVFSESPFWKRLLNYVFIAANIYNTYGTLLGYVYFILFAFFESIYIISKLSSYGFIKR